MHSRTLSAMLITIILMVTSHLALAVNNNQSDEQAAVNSAPVLLAEQAFQLEANLSSPQTLQLNWQIAPGTLLYRHKIKILDAANKTRLMRKQNLPQGKLEDNIDGKDIYVFEDKLSITLPWTKKLVKGGILLSYQGCNKNGFCYSPIYKQIISKDNRLHISNFTGDKAVFQNKHMPSKTDIIISYLAENSAPLALLIFFALGLLLSFTPCMLPLLPITVNIIVGSENKNSTSKAVMLVSTYVLSMALCYTVAGIAAAHLGATIQIWFQQTWFILLVSFLITMFAVIQLEILSPKIWQRLTTTLHFTNKIKNSGTFISVILMGIASALALSPCATPALIGILTYISQTGNPWLGGAALFSMSIGMGMPLIGIALLGKQILPKAGNWLNTIKHLTGFALLGLVIWLLARIISSTLVNILWLTLLIGSAAYLGAFDFTQTSCKWKKFERFVGYSLIIGAVALFINIVKHVNFCSFNKPAQKHISNQIQPAVKIADKPSVSSQTKTDAQESIEQNLQDLTKQNSILPQGTKLQEALADSKDDKASNNFQAVTNAAELKLALDKAKQARMPVLLYFHANWCTYCKDLSAAFAALNTERYLKHFTLLEVDLSHNTPETESMMASYKIFGLPAVLFFNAAGKEQKDQRLAESLKIDALKQHIDQALD